MSFLQGSLKRCFCCGLLFDAKYERCFRWFRKSHPHSLELEELVELELTRRGFPAYYDVDTHRAMIRYARHQLAVAAARDRRQAEAASINAMRYSVPR
jgi:hypothetical protein